MDGVGAKVYWTRVGEVWRANLDGSNAELLFEVGDPGYVRDIALDVADGKIYFSNWGGQAGSLGSLQRANLDGSGLQDVVADIRNGPIGFGVDKPGGKVYWARNGPGMHTGRVRRANLDGSEREALATDIDADAIALHLDAGEVYWTTFRGFFAEGTIERVNLDGSAYEILPLGEIYPGGIAIVSEPSIPCPGDLDADNDVDLADLAILLANYPTPSGATYEDGDLDSDGDVDLADLAALLSVYGTVCE